MGGKRLAVFILSPVLGLIADGVGNCLKGFIQRKVAQVSQVGGEAQQLQAEVQSLPLLELPGHVTESKNNPLHLFLQPEDRGGSAGNLAPESVPGNQLHMLQRLGGGAGAQHLLDRAIGRLTREATDRMVNISYRLSERLLLRVTDQGGRSRVEVGDLSLRIRRDQPIGNGFKEHSALLFQLSALLALLGQLADIL